MAAVNLLYLGHRAMKLHIWPPWHPASKSGWSATNSSADGTAVVSCMESWNVKELSDYVKQQLWNGNAITAAPGTEQMDAL